MGKQSAEPQQPQAILNCIDLSNSNTNQSVSLLKQLFAVVKNACTDSGFFYLVNHGISQDLVDEVFAQSKKLFTLPLQEKMKLLMNDKHRGYTLFLMNSLILKTNYREITKRGIILELKWLRMNQTRINLFMGQTFGLHQIFCQSGGNYGKIPIPGAVPFKGDIVTIIEVGKAVAKLVALALDLDANFFDKPDILGEPIAITRLLHYQDQILDPSQGLYGAGAHTDYGLITLLATDDVPGLQICKDKDVKPQIWEDVAPLKGAFIVNIGDMLERWSNCVFKSTLHRVIGYGQERYSIAYFLEPGQDCLVECLPTCKSDSNPPKFAPIYYRDYLSLRYKETRADLNIYMKQQS